MTDAGCARLDIRRGNIRIAVDMLRANPTPRVLIVDVSQEINAARSLQALAAVAEPSVAVLVIGEAQDLDTYREMTRGLGVDEYLSKPLSRDAVARLFGPVVRGQAYEVATAAGGRSVSITGCSGGVGATTIAVNLAWHLAGTHRRHTCLLDTDLYLGNAALMMDVASGPGLRTALQAPDRIDALFIERAAEMVAEDEVDGRLSFLASEAPVSDEVDYVHGGAAALLASMRMRYNVVIADAPFNAGLFARELLAGVTQRVLVLEPTLASVRGAMRLAEFSSGPAQGRRPIMVLNRLGRPGGLPRAQVEQTLGAKIDVTVPELPGKAMEAANLGRPLIETNAVFKAAVEMLAQQLSVVRKSDPNAVKKGKRRNDIVGFGRLRRK